MGKKVRAAMIVSVGLDETMSKNVKEFSKILVKQK